MRTTVAAARSVRPASLRWSTREILSGAPSSDADCAAARNRGKNDVPHPVPPGLESGRPAFARPGQADQASDSARNPLVPRLPRGRRTPRKSAERFAGLFLRRSLHETAVSNNSWCGCSFQGIHLLNTVNDVLTLLCQRCPGTAPTEHLNRGDDTRRFCRFLPVLTVRCHPRCLPRNLRDFASVKSRETLGNSFGSGAGPACRAG